MFDKIDLLGGAAGKLAGAAGDVGGGLSAMGIVSEETAAKFDQVGQSLMLFAGLADVATTGAALYAAAQEAGGLAALKNAAAQVASRAATVASTVATGAATAATWLWNAAMAANPVGLVVLAIVALIAAFVLAWKHSETFRRIVIGAWEGIKTAAQKVFGWIADYVGFVFNLYAKVFNFGRDIVRGLVDGIQSAIGWIKDKVKGLGKLIPDWLKSVLGIHSPSKVMADLGRNVIKGLNRGLLAEVPSLKRTMSGVSDTLTGIGASSSLSGQVDITGSAGRLGGSGSVTINVTVPPTADAAEVGRQVVKSIEAHERRTGRRRLAPA
jgi:phage-related protein